ncbi:MAG: hypothetical protein HZA50_12085 [Planctomycetes bacterium]|nr:hypothetical protein [Planctomycetota bacterium]
MLGRKLKTTRTDVGLALAFAGFGYLIWAFVAGISRQTVQEFFRLQAAGKLNLPPEAEIIRWVFVKLGVFIDLIGLAWLACALLLIVLSSRQRISISWSWMVAMSQALLAAIGGTLVGWTAYKGYFLPPDPGQTALEQVAQLSLPVIVVTAVVVWIFFLGFLLSERIRRRRRGISLRDGLRSNAYP